MRILCLECRKRRPGEPGEPFVWQHLCLFLLCCLPCCIIHIVDRLTMIFCCAEGMEQKYLREIREHNARVEEKIRKRNEEKAAAAAGDAVIVMEEV